MSAASPTVPSVLAGAGAAFLRSSTRVQHDRAEAVTALPGSLGSRADVIGLLRRWHRLAMILEPRAGGMAPTLLPQLEADLEALGSAVPTIEVAAEPSVPESAAARLGVAWVLLGARLGLRSMADHVEELVGAPLTSLHATEPALLRDLRAEVDDLGHDELAVAVAAAQAAFDTAITELGGPPWST